MEYPHRRYILFLLSKRLQYFEIASDCASKDLVPPNETDVKGLAKVLGPLPSCWMPLLDSKNSAFRKWLSSHEIIDMWLGDTAMKDAQLLLADSRMRKEFEALVLIHGDIDTCRKELELNYPPHRIPSIETLSLYCEYFWDVVSCTRKGLFDFIKASQEHEAMQAAYEGEMERAYAMLGLKRKISDIEYIDNFLQFANLQTVLSTRAGAVLSGQQQIGIATLARASGDLLQMRQGLQQSGSESSLRHDAMMFRAARQKALPIPSIDDLQREGVIDADFEEAGEEAGAIVHRLPTRSRPGES